MFVVLLELLVFCHDLVKKKNFIIFLVTLTALPFLYQDIFQQSDCETVWFIRPFCINAASYIILLDLIFYISYWQTCFILKYRISYHE